MTLDEPTSWRHAEALERRRLLARDRELDWADRKAALDERDATESVEAMEQLWHGIFTRAARERPEIHYLREHG